MKIVAMADCNNANEGEKMSIAKFLTVSQSSKASHLNCLATDRDQHTDLLTTLQLSYVMVPFLSLAVVGSLKASELAIESM